jgi:MerR family redox-sensitive transcriptional activator SoxR
MLQLSISEVARQYGIPASTLRYYERIGVLLPAHRVGGRRSYDEAALRRLALIRRARQSGFRLTEIRELFSGFEPGTPASRRWQQLSARKLAELDASLARIMGMKALLQRVAGCRCKTLDQCGAGVLRSSCASTPGRVAAKAAARRSRPPVR